MKRLQGILVLTALGIACWIGIEAALLVAESRGAVQQIDSLSEQASASIALSTTVLSEERGYYRDSASHVKALTKAAAIDAIQLGRLIETADARLDRISSAAAASLDSAGAASEALREQIESVGSDARSLFQAGTETFQAGTEATQSLGDLARDPSVKESLANLQTSSKNVAEATAEASQAVGYIRDMLSPAKKPFWRRLLELMIPRPTVGIP